MRKLGSIQIVEMVLYQTNMARIRVVNKQTGQTGSMPEENFNAAKYDRAETIGAATGSVPQATPTAGSAELTSSPEASLGGLKESLSIPGKVGQFLFPRTAEFAQGVGSAGKLQVQGFREGDIGKQQESNLQLNELLYGTRSPDPSSPQAKYGIPGKGAAGTEALTEVGIAALLDTLTAGGSKLLKPATSKALKPIIDFLKRRPAGIYRSGLDIGKGAAEKEIRAGKDLAQEAIDRGVTGSVDSLKAQAKKAIQGASKKLNSVLESHSKDILNLKDIINDAFRETVETARTAADTGDLPAIRRYAQELINEYGETVTPVQANKLKQALDGMVKSTFGKASSDIKTVKTMAQRKISDGIRGTLRTKFDDAAGLLDDIHFWSRLDKTLTGTQASNRTGGDIPKGVFGTVSALLRPIRSPEVSSRIGVGAAKVGGAVGGAIDKATSPEVARVLAQLFRGGASEKDKK